MKDPCGPGKGNHELKGKGVFRKGESEGSLKQTADLTYRKRIRHLKRSWTRAKALMKRGVEKEMAWKTAQSRKGPWRCSKTIAMHIAFPNDFFEEIGLVSLLKEKQKMSEVSRTAVYGTVRTVV